LQGEEAGKRSASMSGDAQTMEGTRPSSPCKGEE
jgi:hypothetical protein